MLKFQFQNLPTAKLQSIKLQVIEELNQTTVEGVYFKSLKRYVDARGELTELWSQPWSEDENVAKEVKHVYFNTTHAGVIKAWHVHEQTFSQYTCVQGKMQVVLVDVREKSPTFGQVNILLIGTHNPAFIKIPPGVLKGWKSLAGDSVIVNLLTSANVRDNFKYPWDCILSDIWEPKNG
jgi:dTDP-4-dehydrorhamnose 3,5-epimerase